MSEHGAGAGASRRQGPPVGLIVTLGVMGGAVVLGLAALSVYLIEGTDTDDLIGEIDGDDEGQYTEVVDATAGVTDVLDALEIERTSAVRELIGVEGAVDDSTGHGALREDTDGAVGAIRTLVEGHDGEISQALQPALADLDRLDSVRREIDGSEQPRDLANFEFANGIFDDYAGLIATFLDGGARLSRAIDDPDLARGVGVVMTSARQVASTAELVHALLAAAVMGTLEQPTEITALSALAARFSEDAEVIRSTSAQPYADIVDESFPAALQSDLEALVEEALGGGLVDIAAVFDTVEVPADQSYLGLRERLLDALTEEATRSRDRTAR
jgi:Nitrate and nitrite sensing